MRVAGYLMLPGEAERVRLSPGFVEVEGDAISRVVEGDIQSDADLGGEGCVVCPGLIDAHVHLPQFGVVGAHGLGLLDWLECVTFPAELRWADAEVAKRQTESAIGRMLRCGTTCFAAYATVHRDGTQAALEVAKSLGVRAHIGQVLMDRNAPPELCVEASRLLDETAGLLESYPAGGRVCAAVTPRFAPTCSRELLEGAGDLARQTRALVQTHLAETEAECALVGELFGGASYTEVYNDTGLLGGRSVLGHGIYLDETDRAALARAGAAVAHCPTANSFLMSGRMDLGAAASAGVRVALGSDIGAGYEVSMVRVARAMIETAGALAMDRCGGSSQPQPNLSGAALPWAAEAWWRITAGNADALGWPDAGRLVEGAGADLLVISPGGAVDLLGDAYRSVQGPGVDALSALMFGWDDRWVDQVLVAGKPQL